MCFWTSCCSVGVDVICSGNIGVQFTRVVNVVVLGESGFEEKRM